MATKKKSKAVKKTSTKKVLKKAKVSFAKAPTAPKIEPLAPRARPCKRG